MGNDGPDRPQKGKIGPGSLVLGILLSLGVTLAQTYHDHEIISSNTVWRAVDSPHRILGYVLLTGTATLTLEPGCIVEFEEGAYIGLQNPSTDSLVALVATGTASDSIVFRGWNHAAWNGITLNLLWPNRTQKNPSYFEYCVFEDHANGRIALDHGEIRHCRFGQNSRGAFLEDMDSVLVLDDVFQGTHGLRARSIRYLHIADNRFEGLSHPGVNVEECDTVVIANNLFQDIQSPNGAVRLYRNTSVRITNSNHIAGCSYLLSLFPVSQLDPAYTSLPPTGNTENVLRILGPYGASYPDHLYDFGLPYVMDSLEASPGISWYHYTTLTIDPGVRILVASGYGIQALTLNSNGTASDSVQFTCADTLNRWLGLNLTHGSLVYTIVERADSDSAAGVFLDGTTHAPDVTIGHCTFRHNFYGLVLHRVQSFSLTTENLFDGNREAGLFIRKSKYLRIENQTFRNHLSRYGAILLRDADTVRILAGSGESTNNTWPLTQDIFSQLDSLSVFWTSGNLHNALQYSGIDEESDCHILYSFNVPYCMTRLFGGVRVNGRMEIRPGTRVLFAPQVSLSVLWPDSGHGIYAEGTPSDSIYFQALKPDSGWEGIQISFADTLAAGVFRYCSFSGARSTINGALTLNESPRVPVEHCTFHDNQLGLEIEEAPACSLLVENAFVRNERAGLEVNQSPGTYLAHQRFLNHMDTELGGLYLYESPKVKLTDCTFEANRYPIAMSFNSYLDSLSTFSLTHNQYNAILVVRANSDSVYFYNLGAEYHLGSYTTPPSIGGYVRIDPGVTVRVHPDITFLRVTGTLQALGTPTDSIFFLPLSPDTFWCGLQFRSSGQGQFAYCHFEGVRTGSYGGALYLYQTNQVSVSHSLFKNNSCGLYLRDVQSFHTVVWCTFDGNRYAGIWGRDCDSIELSFNRFQNHTWDSTYGALYFEDSYNLLLHDTNTSLNNRWYLTITPGCLIHPASFILPSERNRIQVVGGSTDTLAYWPRLNQDYEVTGSFVRFSAPVTFEPGVRVYLDSLSSIIFSDTFTLRGTPQDSIVLEATDTTRGYGMIRAEAPGEFRFCRFAYNRNPFNPALQVEDQGVRVDSCSFFGNTYGLKVNQISSYLLVAPNLYEHNACALYLNEAPFAEIRHQTFRWNGTLEGALSLHRSPEVLIAQCTFEENEWPVALDMGSYASRYSRVNLTNNTYPVLRILASSTSSSVTWWPVGADYLVDGMVSVVSGGALTIQSGIGVHEAPVVRFLEHSGMTVRGTLQVWGSVTDSVKFLGYTDTTVWNQISLFNFEAADIRYAVFENASSYGAISANAPSSSLYIRNSAFHYNETALNLMNTYARVDSCQFLWNGTAIQVSGFYSGVDTPVVRKCDIYGNGTGIANTSTALSVKATENFWGHVTGPRDPSPGPPDYNPTGQGDSVSDYVLYRPWLQEPEFGWAWPPGDVNGDSRVDAADIQALAQYLYFHGDPPVPLERGDVNQDNTVDDRDLAALCHQVMQGNKGISGQLRQQQERVGPAPRKKTPQGIGPEGRLYPSRKLKK